MSDKAAERGEVEVVQDGDASIDTKEPLSDEIDPALEKKVLRKVDRNLIPIFFVLQLCSFIDR